MREFRCTIRAALTLTLLTPAAAPAQQAGRTADSAVGRAGQRETRNQPATGVFPTARIDSRIQNRIQSRIRNRIDPGYDPQADATTAIDAASSQARIAGQPHTR